MTNTNSRKDIPKNHYEMWNDGSHNFKAVIKRMIRLGYLIKIVPIERDHQQNQFIGTKSIIV